MHGWRTHAASSVTWCLPLQKSSGRFHITAGWSLLLGFLNKEMSAGIKSTSTNLGQSHTSWITPWCINHLRHQMWTVCSTYLCHFASFCHLYLVPLITEHHWDYCYSQLSWVQQRIFGIPALEQASYHTARRKGPIVKRWLANTHFFRLPQLAVYTT